MDVYWTIQQETKAKNCKSPDSQGNSPWLFFMCKNTFPLRWIPSQTIFNEQDFLSASLFFKERETIK